jgi:uncharacterized protein
MERTPFTGLGLGLRRPHLEAAALDAGLGVPFWETCPENLIGEGGRHRRWATAILERDPVLTHGLVMSVGGFDPWDLDYLAELGAFLTRAGTPWHSEHLCFSTVDGTCLHDLLPLPFTREALRHTIARVKDLQARLPVPLILENITYYAPLGRGEMDEAEFITEVLEGADAGWLLDINNVYVNALNFGFEPREWLARTPLHRVAQMHIAGHKTFGKLTVDTHGADVIEPVAELMAWALRRIGRRVPVLLERDNHLPALADLLAERARLQAVYDGAFAPAEAALA